MSVTLTTATRTVACDAIVDLVDTGSGDATGDMAFGNSGGTLCVNNMTNPAFGAASSGVATAATIADGTVSGSSNPSTIDRCLFRNRANTEQFRCAVSTSGSDINLTNVTVNNGDVIQMTSLTYTVPAT
jgi:hypothetical protein